MPIIILLLLAAGAGVAAWLTYRGLPGGLDVEVSPDCEQLAGSVEVDVDGHLHSLDVKVGPLVAFLARRDRKVTDRLVVRTSVEPLVIDGDIAAQHWHEALLSASEIETLLRGGASIERTFDAVKVRRPGTNDEMSAEEVAASGAAHTHRFSIRCVGDRAAPPPGAISSDALAVTLERRLIGEPRCGSWQYEWCYTDHMGGVHCSCHTPGAGSESLRGKSCTYNTALDILNCT